MRGTMRVCRGNAVCTPKEMSWHKVDREITQPRMKMCKYGDDEKERENWQWRKWRAHASYAGESEARGVNVHERESSG